MLRESPPGLLLIDSEPAQAGLIGALAQRAGWRVLRASDVPAAAELARVKGNRVDVALLDLWSGDDRSARSITLLRTALPSLPIVAVAAQDPLDTAVRALRAGARDVVLRPVAAPRLLAALDHAADMSPAGELRPLAEKWSGTPDFDGIVGANPAFRKAVDAAIRAAGTSAAILIEGEAGVGKEMLARAIHRASTGERAPFVAVDCAAIPANLIDSELFGHERNAFPGAFERRAGRFADADGGTIFLDGIASLSADTQERLLRVLQSGEIRPLGAVGGRPLAARLIAATNRRLSEAVEQGRFREDLFYRLAATSVALPPLRDRAEDIAPLARHLLDHIIGRLGLDAVAIEPEAMALLETAAWPGNVRQLHDVLFRTAISARRGSLAAADFPQLTQAQMTAIADEPAATRKPTLVQPPRSLQLFGPDGHVRPMDAIEADLIRLAIGHYHGRMTEVARRLRIGRSTLYRKLNELGIEQAN